MDDVFSSTYATLNRFDRPDETGNERVWNCLLERNHWQTKNVLCACSKASLSHTYAVYSWKFVVSKVGRQFWNNALTVHVREYTSIIVVRFIKSSKLKLVLVGLKHNRKDRARLMKHPCLFRIVKFTKKIYFLWSF